jgi:hypothetical protein
MERILSFLSGGIVGGFLGAFFGGFTKFFWERWLPDRLTWRREQEVAREKLLSQFRGPAIRAIYDLQGRIYVIVQKRAANYEYLKKVDQDEYYVDSTAFLVAQCYAWMEILREKMATFDYADLFNRLEGVTASFASGRPGFQIFRLEQREIGERMLRVTGAGEVGCLAYSEFLDALRTTEAPKCFSGLTAKVILMLEDWPKEVVRLTRIQHALVETVNFIDPDARWVPKHKRDMLNVEEVLKGLVDGKLISKGRGESLIKEAREMAIPEAVA